MSSHSYVLPLILIVAGPITVAAAEMDVSKCPANNQWQDAFNKGDANSIAAMYAPGAIEVTPEGIRVGPAAVKERVERGVKEDKMSNMTIVATKCDGDNSLRWSSGTWKAESSHGPVSGFWTAIEAKEGNSWKMQNLTYNVTPPPPPAK
jgi:ketosteroid isomerase-like protein